MRTEATNQWKEECDRSGRVAGEQPMETAAVR